MKASFERNIYDSSHNRSPKHKENNADADAPEKSVSTNKKAWDKLIGDWVFNGIQQSPAASPLKPKMRQPSSEVRVPTPLSTPLGSTDNLLIDSGSRYNVYKASRLFYVALLRIGRAQIIGYSSDIHTILYAKRLTQGVVVEYEIQVYLL